MCLIQAAQLGPEYNADPLWLGATFPVWPPAHPYVTPSLLSATVLWASRDTSALGVPAASLPNVSQNHSKGLSRAEWLSWQLRGPLSTHGIQLVHLLLLWDFHGGCQDFIPFELLVELLQCLSGLSVCIFQIIRWILFGLFFIYKTAWWP